MKEILSQSFTQNPIMFITFHPDGKRVALADSTHYVKFFDIVNKVSLTEMWTLH